MRSDGVLELSVAALEDVRRGVESLRGCARQGLPTGTLAELVRATVSARRTASPRMRRALAPRDRRCVWDRCDRPPAWCAGLH